MKAIAHPANWVIIPSMEPKDNQNSNNVTISSLQSKLARTALGLGVREAADLSNVSPNTIARLERGENLRSKTVSDIRTAYEEAGVRFIDANGGGVGVRLSR